MRPSLSLSPLDERNEREDGELTSLARSLAVPFAKGKVTIPYAPDDTATDLGPVKELTARNKALALRYFDFEFLDRPRQCDDPAVCDAFEKEFNWSGWMGPDEQNEYKYMLDVDGNGWSGRFHRCVPLFLVSSSSSSASRGRT